MPAQDWPGLTDLQYTMTVTDTVTGAVRTPVPRRCRNVLPGLVGQ